MHRLCGLQHVMDLSCGAQSNFNSTTHPGPGESAPGLSGLLSTRAPNVHAGPEGEDGPPPYSPAPTVISVYEDSFVCTTFARKDLPIRPPGHILKVCGMQHLVFNDFKSKGESVCAHLASTHPSLFLAPSKLFISTRPLAHLSSVLPGDELPQAQLTRPRTLCLCLWACRSAACHGVSRPTAADEVLRVPHLEVTLFNWCLRDEIHVVGP